MPAILERQNDEYEFGHVAGQPTHLVGEVLGPIAKLRYIVERMEQWPQRFSTSRRSAWSSFGSELAKARLAAAPNSPRAGRRRNAAVPADREPAATDPEYQKLEPRVLKLVIDELKLHLRTGELGNHDIFQWSHYDTFWQAKIDDFARAANEVFQESKSSGSTAERCAEYLSERLDRHGAALEMLLAANQAGTLNLAQQQKLIGYLHRSKRYAESIPLLEAMTRDQPDAVGLRGLLMVAYFRTDRPGGHWSI